MNKKEYNLKKLQLQEKIAFNHKIHCERVAAKYERLLRSLEYEYENYQKDISSLRIGN